MKTKLFTQFQTDVSEMCNTSVMYMKILYLRFIVLSRGKVFNYGLCSGVTNTRKECAFQSHPRKVKHNPLLKNEKF